MNPAHKAHERESGDMSQDQKLHHQQMLEPLRVSISPTDIADRIAYRRQAGTALIGVPPDLEATNGGAVGRCSARMGRCRH
jgi:hypothetical protein